MATKSKKALPEYTTSQPELVAMAKQILAYRAEIADLEKKEGDLKKSLIEHAEQIRLRQQGEKNQYIGLVKVVDADMSPVQVQFKICGGALALEQGPVLDRLFCAARPMLFEKDVAITGITDPDALITEIRDRGQNPYDYLDITVKKNLDRALADSPNVTKLEGYLPKEGFLATLNEIAHAMGDDAKAYINKYIGEVLKPSVSAGHK